MSLAHYHQTRLALGSDTTLTIVGHDLSTVAAEKLLADLWLRVFRFERQFSRFIPDSGLSRFNARAGSKTQITPAFQVLLEAARGLAARTNNLFNPFILPALQRIGYQSSFVQSYAADEVPQYSGRLVASYEALEIGDGWARIPHGAAIDLGGCGKGYLADQLAHVPAVQGLAGFWFSLGGDIAGGGVDADGSRWDVAVQDAHNPTLTLSNKLQTSGKQFAVATSGTIVRQWTSATDDGAAKSWHHIIDPRTMQPADSDILLATCTHDSACEADVLASCAVILGSKLAPGFLAERGSRDWCLQLQNGNVLRAGDEQATVRLTSQNAAASSAKPGSKLSKQTGVKQSEYRGQNRYVAAGGVA